MCKFLCGILLTMLILAVASCRHINYGDPSISFSGVVIDAETQLPLDSVWLALDDTTYAAGFMSDTLGQFTVATLGVHLQQVVIYAGRESYLTLVDTLRDVRTDVTDLHYELEKAP